MGNDQPYDFKYPTMFYYLTKKYSYKYNATM